jgi:hypothetical protein|tara:strand:+ start:97 stop:501 length:405 start_codon:yes stop_codon:yes gene_type:complete
MNSFFRKVATPLLSSSIFKKGIGGLTSLFKKAPSLTQAVGQVRKASNIADKVVNNPVAQLIAEQQGLGTQFNLAKQGAGRLNQLADLGDKGVGLQQRTRELRDSVKNRDALSNILEKVKNVKGDVDEIRAVKFA